MAERAGVQAADCPRCGTALRFEDEDGTRECVCGWSERARDPLTGTVGGDAGLVEGPDDEAGDPAISI